MKSLYSLGISKVVKTDGISAKNIKTRTGGKAAFYKNKAVNSGQIEA